MLVAVHRDPTAQLERGGDRVRAGRGLGEQLALDGADAFHRRPQRRPSEAHADEAGVPVGEQQRVPRPVQHLGQLVENRPGGPEQAALGIDGSRVLGIDVRSRIQPAGHRPAPRGGDVGTQRRVDAQDFAPAEPRAATKYYRSMS